MEAPTGYKRWLVGIVVSLIGALSSILYVTYASGQNVQQMMQNKMDIERLQDRQAKQDDRLATKDDVKRVEDKVDRLIDRELNKR